MSIIKKKWNELVSVRKNLEIQKQADVVIDEVKNTKESISKTLSDMGKVGVALEVLLERIAEKEKFRKKCKCERKPKEDDK